MVTDFWAGTSPVARRASALLETVVGAVTQEAALGAAAAAIADRLHRGGTVYAIGNGGAAALAEHLIGELVGRLSSDRERPPLSAYCLSSDTTVLTAIAETEGFAECYAAQLRVAARPADVLVVFTTSGTSANLVTAVAAAEAIGMYRVAFTGPAGSPMDRCETVVHAPSTRTGTVQECHLLMLHALVEQAEDALAEISAASGARG